MHLAGGVRQGPHLPGVLHRDHAVVAVAGQTLSRFSGCTSEPEPVREEGAEPAGGGRVRLGRDAQGGCAWDPVYVWCVCVCVVVEWAIFRVMMTECFFFFELIWFTAAAAAAARG